MPKGFKGFQKGHPNYVKKHPRGMLGKIHPSKGKKRPGISGENHPMWKGGIFKNKEYQKEWRKKHIGYWKKYNIKLKEKRHRLGINKIYKEKYATTPEQIRQNRIFNRKAYKYRYKNAGILSKKTIQIVYEDNIKRFGTLTCYLCLNSIEFGKDHLEHKIPLVRGGTNEYNNLAIACQKCNCKKHNKTEEEFIKMKGVNK